MKRITLALISSAALAVSACGGDTETTNEMDNDTAMMDDDGAMEDGSATNGTIVEVAQGDDQFSTLVGAVTTANLAETLGGEGPFTVFAPTNDAFGKIDEATLNGLMDEGSRDQLTSVLTYHVVSGEVMAADLLSQIEAANGSLELDTVAGGTLTASVQDGNVILTDANGGTSTVTATDVDASNGVIHVIDTVLMPAG